MAITPTGVGATATTAVVAFIMRENWSQEKFPDARKKFRLEVAVGVSAPNEREVDARCDAVLRELFEGVAACVSEFERWTEVVELRESVEEHDDERGRDFENVDECEGTEEFVGDAVRDNEGESDLDGGSDMVLWWVLDVVSDLEGEIVRDTGALIESDATMDDVAEPDADIVPRWVVDAENDRDDDGEGVTVRLPLRVGVADCEGVCVPSADDEWEEPLAEVLREAECDSVVSEREVVGDAERLPLDADRVVWLIDTLIVWVLLWERLDRLALRLAVVDKLPELSWVGDDVPCVRLGRDLDAVALLDWVGVRVLKVTDCRCVTELLDVREPVSAVLVLADDTDAVLETANGAPHSAPPSDAPLHTSVLCVAMAARLDAKLSTDTNEVGLRRVHDACRDDKQVGERASVAISAKRR
jgi:hypothetical protein